MDLVMGLFSAPKYLHLVGIKGQGMTALAQVLAARGHHVSGSDVEEVFSTDAVLARLGIPVAKGFAAKNVPPRTQILMYSAAYTSSNPELQEAKVRGIRLMVYPEALGEYSKDFFSIGISGMHGKTTTTAMLGQILTECAIDPTVVVGTPVPAFNGNARIGEGKILVAETCEYRRHFLYFSPNVILLTNLEPEHLDYYRDIDDIESAFLSYIERLSPWRSTARERLSDDGTLVAPSSIPPTLIACVDDPGVQTFLPKVRERFPDLSIITYGFREDADCRATNHHTEGGRQVFDATMRGAELGSFTLAVPGRMNVTNALGAIAATLSLPTSVSGRVPTATSIRQALASYQGTTRRFQILGIAAGVAVVDDYAHHPTEIRATMEAARQYAPHARIFVDFMPHTVSRTKTLLAEFGLAFQGAERVVVNEIYTSAREAPDTSVTPELVAAEISKHQQGAVAIPSLEDAARKLLTELKPGDLFLALGAGSSWRVAEMVLEGLRKREHAASSGT